MLRDREQSGRPRGRRGPTLGREHGPVAVPADAAHQLGSGTGIPARRQGPGRGRLQRTGPVLGHVHRPGDRPAPSSGGESSSAWLTARTARCSRWVSPRIVPASPALGSGIPRQAGPSANYCPARTISAGLEFRPDGRALLAGRGTRLESLDQRSPGCGTRPEGRRSVSRCMKRHPAGSVPTVVHSSRWEGTARSSFAMPATGEALATLLTSSSAGHLCGVSRRWRPGRRGFRGRRGPALRPGHESAGRPAPVHETRRPSRRIHARRPVRRRHRRARRIPHLARPRAAPGREHRRPDAADRGPDRPADGGGPGDLPARRPRPGASGSSSSAGSIPPPCSPMTIPPGTSR